MNKKWLSLTIEKNSSLIEALKQMDQVGCKLLIVMHRRVFEGLISIGDIQRSIIQNCELSTSVSNILRTDFIIGHVEENEDTIKEKMYRIRAEFMPILNDNKDVIDVVFWDDIIKSEKLPPSYKINVPVVIMAGGKGTRLKPITNVLPKPLIPIGNKTIVEHIMDRFIHVGCTNFHFSVNFKSDMIKYYFSSLGEKSYEIDFFEEDKPLGTAGSLHLLNGRIKSPFFVSNCDIIIDQDYSEIYKYHKDNDNELTLVVALKHYKIPYGTIESGEKGILDSIVEKPELTYKINAGLYLLEPHLLDEIPRNKFFHITHLIEKIKDRGGKVGVFPGSEK
jgi:UTP-glucose-1-phosphate uridylyltransferase